MREYQIHRLCAALLATLLLLALPFAGAEEAGTQYFENAWNYVDGSMDILGAIPEDAEGVLGDIRAAGVLRVATEPYYPPQEFIDPGLSGQDMYVGADMELARLIARRMGVELEIVPMDFSDVLPAVMEGVCDLAISGLSYTPARAAQVTMSKGYHYAADNAGTGLVIRAEDAEAIRGPEDLENRNIVAQASSLQETLMAEYVPLYHEFRRVSSVQEVFQGLQEGWADAAAMDIDNARIYIQSNPDCGLMLVPDVCFALEEQFDGDRVAAKKGELQLMYFVNGVIDEILTSGQYEAWFEEYGTYASELGL